MHIGKLLGSFAYVSLGSAVACIASKQILKSINSTTETNPKLLGTHTTMAAVGAIILAKGSADLYQLFFKKTNPLIERFHSMDYIRFFKPRFKLRK